jgi:hypothetical protein
MVKLRFYFLALGLGIFSSYLASKIELSYYEFFPAIKFWVHLVILAPALEETLKLIAAKLSFKWSSTESIYLIITAGYGFTIMETIYYMPHENDYYIRLILPTHLLFTLVSCKNLFAGIFLHSAWNFGYFASTVIPLWMPLITLVYYFIFFWNIQNPDYLISKSSLELIQNAS